MLGDRGKTKEQEGPLQRASAGASPKEGKDGPDRLAQKSQFDPAPTAFVPSPRGMLVGGYLSS